MAGFGDHQIAIVFDGLTATSGLNIGALTTASGGFAWVLNQPANSAGTVWNITSGSPNSANAFQELYVEIFDVATSLYYVLTPNTDYTYSGTSLYIAPAFINALSLWTALSTSQSRFNITLWYRAASQQFYIGSGNSAFSPSSISSQLDITTRIAQEAFEMASRTLQFHPSDALSYDLFTGLNLHPSKGTLPPAAQRGNAILGFDATGLILTMYQGLPSALSTASPTPFYGIIRDSLGRAQIVDGDTTFGTVSGYIASETWVEDWVAAQIATLTATITAQMLAKIMPVGSVIRQGPNDASPASLYPGTTWANVSYEEQGTSLRVGTNITGASFKSGAPAQITITVTAGVPSFAIVSGGSGYLSGGSGTIPLTLTGACTTQWAGTATVTSGVITAINTTTAGIAYLSSGSATGASGANFVANVGGTSAVILYDGVYRIAGTLLGHIHSGSYISGTGGGYSFATNSGYQPTNIGQVTADGSDGAALYSAENTMAHSPAIKWRRAA